MADGLDLGVEHDDRAAGFDLLGQQVQGEAGLAAAGGSEDADMPRELVRFHPRGSGGNVRPLHGCERDVQPFGRIGAEPGLADVPLQLRGVAQEPQRPAACPR